MKLKSLIFSIYNRLCGKNSALNDGLHRSESSLTPDLPPSATRKRNAALRGGRRHVNFDLAEALRRLADGWSYRKIARKMGISRETVRTRILDYEAQFRVATPEPVRQPPIVSVQQSAPACKALLALPIAPKAAPVPVVSVVTPPPEPYGLASIPPGCKAFFLVNGEQNSILARNCAQIAVGIERWHPSYAMLPAFRDADRFWVVMNSDDDNRAFLMSLVGDIRIRERCAVSRGDSLIGAVRWTWVQTVCKSRMLIERSLHREWWSSDTKQFEAIYNLQPMPQPNHTRELEALLAPPPEPEKASPGGSWGEPYGFAKYGGFGSNSH